MKIYLHLWYYLAQFSFELEMIQTKVEEKIKTYFMFNTTFPKIVSFVR
jgi:hypothetical protein